MAIKKGIYAASISLFNKDLSLDADSTIKHCEKIIQYGCHGVVLFGPTGQAQLISSNEKKELIKKLNENKFKDNFIIGTGNNSLNENIELMKFSLNNGINKFLLMPPAYYKYDDNGAYSYYSKIIKVLIIPIVPPKTPPHTTSHPNPPQLYQNKNDSRELSSILIYLMRYLG